MFITGLIYSTLQDGGDVFTGEGMPRIPFPNGWKGGNGLYTVGFSQRGLLGTSSDALNVARDLHCQFGTRAGSRIMCCSRVTALFDSGANVQ
jgi:hypothetical protein